MKKEEQQQKTDTTHHTQYYNHCNKMLHYPNKNLLAKYEDIRTIITAAATKTNTYTLLPK